MDELMKVVKDLDPNDLQTRREIFTYIGVHILSSSSSPLQDVSPPPALYKYAVFDILHPMFLLDQIPDLLDLLVALESVRQRVFKGAEYALSWHKFYKRERGLQWGHGEGEVLLLTDAEIVTLRRIADEKRSANSREIYCRLICRCCELHIYHVWAAGARDRARRLEALTEYMDDYFPDGNVSRRIFHEGLDPAERIEVHKTEEACLQFLDGAAQWEQKREEQLVAQGVTVEEIMDDEEFFSYSEDFADAFPPDVNVNELVDTVEWYVNGVVEKVSRIGAIFK